MEKRSSYLGKSAHDIISGFTGIVTGHIEYLSCTDQLCISPKVDPSNGGLISAQWFEINRLKILDTPGSVVVDEEPEDNSPDRIVLDDPAIKPDPAMDT